MVTTSAYMALIMSDLRTAVIISDPHASSLTTSSFPGWPAKSTLIPVVKSVSADLLTPVSAFLAIAGNEPHAFLLESVERGEQIGRYTFLGARPYMQSAGAAARSHSATSASAGKAQGQCVPHRERCCCGEHRPATCPGLPPFTAGAVGYFAYDVVRQLENIGDTREG